MACCIFYIIFGANSLEKLMWKTLLVLPFLFTQTVSAQKSVSRHDAMIASDPGVRIFVRELKARKRSRKPPILLVHGGGPGGIASFDLPVPGGSLAEDLAQEGMDVYIMDIRGWEKSTRPDYDTTRRWVIAGSSKEAAADIDAVVDYMIERSGKKQVCLFGWATGGHWIGYYACMYPDKISSLILLNSLYNVKAPWNYNEVFRSREDTTQFDYVTISSMRRATKQSLLASWKKDSFYDPAIAKAYAETAVGFYPDSLLEVPGGYRVESFYTAQGKGLWHARDIRVPLLAMRSDLDTWSRPEDMAALEQHLTNAPKKKFVVLPKGTHHVFLSRPEEGRAQLISEIIAFNVKRKSR